MANRQIDELTYASTITDATSIPVNNNTATYEAQQLTVGKLGDFLGSRASAVHNLGDVYTNKSSLVIDNPGALPAWTGEYITNANNTYPDLYTWLKTSHSELCVTRAAYDAAITADGECKYFVIDEESGSIRFPKYSYTAPEYPWIYCFNAAVPQTTTQGAEYTASLISKVSKAGDTMTGQLVMANGSNGIKFQGTNDNNYYVNLDSQNILKILDKNGKGFMLDGSSNSIPVYTDGNNTYNLHYVVDSYINGTSWYRLYNDGWLEQGGIYTGSFTTNNQFTLLKEFSNTDYTVITNALNTSSTPVAACYGVNTKTTTYFSGEAFRGSSGNLRISTLYWYAYGYAA